ncbi:hypothetical protein T265_09620 [Opisthorchis viverrini]|uniref:Uncharacterized protein n=1 Tax=Opisthorchis viverrini TaxID=6198 RepID=A0A074Z5A9_OPIVI|nr:hypothetical protein T265_09620 [Opisthorchis viverrini]KER22258.1 hypothetical protein T265_09620 [Opisthorchis viverrini]
MCQPLDLMKAGCEVDPVYSQNVTEKYLGAITDSQNGYLVLLVSRLLPAEYVEFRPFLQKRWFSYSGTNFRSTFENIAAGATNRDTKPVESIIGICITIIIDSMTSVFNTEASLPYNHDLFENRIVKKRVKVDGQEI